MGEEILKRWVREDKIRKGGGGRVGWRKGKNDKRIGKLRREKARMWKIR